MSRTIAPPRPGAPGTAAALFAEARRRRRRRRLTGLAVILALAATGAIAFTAARPPRAAVATDADGRRPGAASMAGATLSGFVAWVDYNRRVHLGDLATGAQYVVGRSTADPAVPLVQAGGHLYWADYWATGKRVVVQELNPATGKVRSVGRGQSPFGVFTSADGRHVFLAPTDTRVIELPARGPGAKRELTLPRGWYLPYGWSVGVAHGILVHSGGQTTRSHTVMAVWNPGTGALKVIIGRGSRVMAASTPPGARYSLLAWEPAGCSAGQNCPLSITNTATLSTKTLRSPLHHGFAGAAFSPDGNQLAVFAATSSDGTGAVQLAMVNTGTGTLRLAASIRLPVSCGSGWALWLPDGRHLIAGGYDTSYTVNAATLSARPLYFTHSRDHYIQTSQDINYSAAVVPLRR